MRTRLAAASVLLMCASQGAICAPQNANTAASVPSRHATSTSPPRQTANPVAGKVAPRQAQASPLGRKTDVGAVANLVALIVALILTYLCCHPVLAFARRGWSIKRADIFSSLTTSSKKLYLTTFNLGPSSDADAAFEEIYNFRYGRYRLKVPVALLVLVVLPLLYLEVSTGLAGLILETDQGSTPVFALARSGAPLITFPNVAAAAVAGAFVWVVASLTDDAARYNLPPHAVLGAALRLAVSIPLGYAVQSLAANEIAPFVAFAIGAFPLGEVQVILKRIATNKLGLEAGADHAKDQVTILDGIDQPTADRLEDGDVLTVSQLAYCDPVQLSMRTNLSFTSIIDAQSQALAWIYLGDSLPQLFGVGFRGAIEIGHFFRALQTESDASGPLHQLLLVASARTAVGPNQVARQAIDPIGLRHAFEEIAGDPYTEFLTAVWASSGQPAPTVSPQTAQAVRVSVIAQSTSVVEAIKPKVENVEGSNGPGSRPPTPPAGTKSEASDVGQSSAPAVSRDENKPAARSLLARIKLWFARSKRS